MVASRYDTPAQTAAADTAKVQGSTQNTTGNSTTQGTTQGASNTDTTQHSVVKGTTSSSTTNMDPTSLAALNLLIQQLMGGGSQQTQVANAERQQEIQRNEGQAADYTKAAAFNDAQGLMAQTMQQTLQQLLPSINRGAEGAGASQGSMRALLTQQAAFQAAQAASAQGLQAATAYAGANAQFGSLLEKLTQPDNTNNQNLLNALQIAKGAVTSTQGSSSQTTDTTGNSQQQQTQQSNQQTQDNKNVQTTVGNPSTTSGSSDVNQLVQFGNPDQSPTTYAGTSVDFSQQLQQLTGGGSAGWSGGSNFTF